MKFIETLSRPPRLLIDLPHLRTAIAAFGERYSQLSVAVLRPGPAADNHTLLLHTAPGQEIPAGGLPVAISPAAVEAHLDERDYALLVASASGFQPLFRGGQSVFLRRVWIDLDQPLLLAFAIEGLDAGFVDRHGTALMTERLLHRIDDHIMQSRIDVITQSLQRQITEVKTVKEKLLPTPEHRVAGLEYAVHYVPREGGGGDYFEVADLIEARRRAGSALAGTYWGVIIGDVSGHGPGAAVEVAMLDSILRTYRPTQRAHPGEVLSYCNRHMFTRQLRGGFATVFIANYNAGKEKLIFSSAGHPPGIVKPADGGASRLLECGGDIPLGVETEHEWQSESTRFGARDMLVLYTDGVTEAQSPAGQQLGIEALSSAVSSSRATNPRTLLDDILAVLHSHTGGEPLVDDCTILVAQPAA